LDREQDFTNYLALNNYRKAMQLALVMEQPGRLLSLFKGLRSASALAPPDHSITGDPSVDEVIRTLPGSDLVKLLRYVRDWNTNAKTSDVAQGVLHAVVKLRTVDDFMRAFGDEAGEAALASSQPLDASREKSAGAGGTAMKEMVDAMIPYTERHLARIEKLVQDSYVVDYILGEMDDGMFDGDLDSDNSVVMDVDTLEPR
jgi:U3 small nucleolar RNA-associated protein 13